VEDKNKEVQQSACFALATISEHAANDILPYAQAIFTQFHRAMNSFQRKNLISLYDAIGMKLGS
jgi:transportin-1